MAFCKNDIVSRLNSHLILVSFLLYHIYLSIFFFPGPVRVIPACLKWRLGNRHDLKITTKLGNGDRTLLAVAKAARAPVLHGHI
jgi:hypothetical protein